MTENEIEKLLLKAIATNKSRDKEDASAGFASPTVCPDDMLLRTAMSAIMSGLQGNLSVDCIAEGFVMLNDLHVRMKGVTYLLPRLKHAPHAT